MIWKLSDSSSESIEQTFWGMIRSSDPVVELIQKCSRHKWAENAKDEHSYLLADVKLLVLVVEWESKEKYAGVVWWVKQTSIK